MNEGHMRLRDLFGEEDKLKKAVSVQIYNTNGTGLDVVADKPGVRGYP